MSLPAESVGNRELLALVMALQDSRHWLERAAKPFFLWTDHKNLAYLRRAKRLNSWQTRWALVLGRFSFTLTYWPGSKNTKPDALSRQFSSDPACQEPEPILSPACVVRAVAWQVKERVREALCLTADTGGAPPNTLFFLEAARFEVLQ